MTVHVHGAGLVAESTTRNLMNCDVSPASVSEASVFNCVAGSPSGGYALGDIVQLDASVPEASAAFARGWRFLKWVDSSSSGQINCDPQASTGDMFTAACRFQIFENLQTNLYFDDVHGPTDTTLSDGPTSPTKQTTAAFTFNAPSDPDATFECKLDRPGLAGSFVTCGGPLDKGENYSGLTTNGTYSLSFRSKDPSGNIGNPFFTRSWVVDTVAPAATIGGGPAQGSTVTTDSASFSVGTNEAGPLTCSIDGTAAACTAGSVVTYNSLGQGAHTFVLTATDQAGNVGSQTRNWTVDTVAPDAPNITSGPDAPTSSKSAIFGFTGPGDAASFRCQLDTGLLAPCVSPVAYESLPDGSHTVTITARDAAGNVSTAATRTWSVDATAPAVPPLFGTGTTRTNLTVSWPASSDASAPVSYDVFLDGTKVGTTELLTYTVTGLQCGHAYLLGIEAVDGLANRSTRGTLQRTTAACPDTLAPNTRMIKGPPARTTARTATFRFASTEEGSRFQCKLDRGAFKSCGSPKTYRNLKKGSHTFQVRAIDKAGNRDTSPAKKTWRIR